MVTNDIYCGEYSVNWDVLSFDSEKMLYEK